MAIPRETGVPPGALSALLRELVDVGDAPEDGWDRGMWPGRRVGRFELIRRIGRGGFGVVWEARDESGRSVAWKGLRRVGAVPPRADRLLTEAEIAGRLSHPNIVHLEAAGRTDEGPYVVFELLRGETLATRLEAGAMPVAEALRIATAVASALAYAHDEGVVHRDLKPANVFLCDDGSVKVLDFGLALVPGRRKIDGGTPAYMAPEQLRGAPEDERSDVFALGVLLYRMLAGELPRREAAAPDEPAPGLEIEGLPDLTRLVADLLERDPVARPRDGSAVLPRLRTALAQVEQRSRDGAVVQVAIARRRVPARTGSPGAREHHARGREFLRQTRRSSLRFAADMFQRAIDLDPDWAAGHAGLAEACGLLHMYYPREEQELDRAERASRRAVELDPDSAGAHASRGLVLSLQGHSPEARRSFERALALDPKLFEAWYYLARISFREGRLEEAERLFSTAYATREDYQASFFTAQVTEALGRHAEALERYAEALAVAERHMDLNPDDPRAATMRAVALCRTGRRAEGLRWAAQARTLDPQDAGVLYNVACLFALEGQRDDALRCLEDVLRAGFRDREWMRRDPDLASLRGDPRFEALMTSA